MIKLETERLILREIDPERDFEGWASLMADEETVRYIGGKTLCRANAWRNMAMVMGHWSIRGYGFFSVEEKHSGAWIGRVGPWFPEGWPQPEVGWAILKEHCGKGYASEAGSASIDYAYQTLGWSSVIHIILDGNAGSVGVAQKVGSRLISHLDNLPGITDDPVMMYGQDRPPN